ncbi:MAG: TIM-barrel domain-containing protein [Microthrixaceae bacterium]
MDSDHDRPPTRHLERLEVDRLRLLTTTVRQAAQGSVVLDVACASDTTATRLPDGVALAGDRVEAGSLTVRIDAVGPRTFRYRFALADDVPTNDTPMLATDVAVDASARVERSGAVVTLRTDEASLEIDVPELGGPTIRVRNADGNVVGTVGGGESNLMSAWDAFPTGISRTPLVGHRLATEVFSLGEDECVYGFGEQFGRLDKVGQTIDIDMEEALGTVTPRAYKNVPFWVTTAGWGVFANHDARLTAWIGSRSAPQLQVAVDDDWFDAFVFVGDVRQVLGAYTELTGRPNVPPDWSFGFWQSKISYSSAAETLEVAERMRAAELPFDVLHLDTHWFRSDWYCDLEFDPTRFPDPEGYLRAMAAMGVKVSLWQLPYIPEGSALFDELAAVDGFVRREDGSLYDIGLCYSPDWTGGQVGCIDFSNPAAVQVHQRWLGRLFDLGARAIKVDFGEQAPLDGVYHDGTPGHRMHNRYPLLYNQAVAEATHAATGEWIIWARAAFAGSQRYPLHWGGDSSARWDNLFADVGGGLSLGLCGFPFWSMDIGGFLGEPDDDLLIRWLQAGLFLSHSRIHGFGDRELYDRGATTDVARDLLQLRYRLLPYLLGQAHLCATQGVPLARALVVDHPDDPSTWHLGNQWLLGDDLLVAPVADPDGRRRVYLPEGEWVHWFTGEAHRGPRWITTHSPLEQFPLYQRAGSLIPLAPVMAHVGERPVDVLTLRIGDPSAVFDWTGVARVDGEAVTISTARPDDGVVVAGLPADVEVRLVDGTGNVVDRPVRRT